MRSCYSYLFQIVAAYRLCQLTVSSWFSTTVYRFSLEGEGGYRVNRRLQPLPSPMQLRQRTGADQVSNKSCPDETDNRWPATDDQQ